MPASTELSYLRSESAPILSRVTPAFVRNVEAILIPLSVLVAGYAAKLLYLDVLVTATVSTSSYLAIGVLAALFLALLNSGLRIDAKTVIQSDTMQLGKLLAAITIMFLLLLGFFYLLKISDVFSRGWLLAWYVLSVAGGLASRIAVAQWIRKLRSQGRLIERVAVYGDRNLARIAVDRLRSRSGHHRIDPFIFTNDAGADSTLVHGGMNELIDRAQKEPFDLIIVTLPASADREIRDAAANLEVLPVDVKLSPGAVTLPPQTVAARNDYDGLLLIDLLKPPFGGGEALVKATMDFVIAAVALVAAAPVMLAIALAIKLDSRGPVFFVQRRHGYNNRVVRVTKFRSMTVSEDSEVVQAVRGDKRVTRIGRFLRKTSLDELPQLFDVLRGDLSLVGPRPHALSHNEHYARIIERYSIRHKVKPGITGWAQVNGCRGETAHPDAMRKRLECDLYYIDNWSIGLDLRILAKTLLVPFHDANAY